MISVFMQKSQRRFCTGSAEYGILYVLGKAIVFYDKTVGIRQYFKAVRCSSTLTKIHLNE